MTVSSRYLIHAHWMLVASSASAFHHHYHLPNHRGIPTSISNTQWRTSFLAPRSRFISSKELHELSNTNDDQDFDPLLSPHAYSSGTNSKSLEKEDKVQKEEEGEDNWTPFKMPSVKNDFQGASEEDYRVEKSTFTRQWSTTINTVKPTTTTAAAAATPKEEAEQDDAFFDPLISPHAYPKGTTSKPLSRKDLNSNVVQATSEKTNTVGVLLIDHGSRRQSSNDRLMQIANLYQSRAPSNYIVKAAHMEIADPSIQNVIREFVKDGVMKIVCHPYFLSPGRHVLEDIPELIEEAVDVMKQEFELDQDDLEVLTTDPVGSNLDLMVGLIGKMVDEKAGYDAGFVEKEENKDYGALGGFFGEVQRMMEED